MLESFHLQRSQDLVNACWQEKTALTRRLLELPPHRLMRPEVIGDRTRLDLLWAEGALGIYTPGRSLLRIDYPDTVCPPLARMMQEFLDSRCPLPKSNVRFRAGPGGLAGLWVDTANENIRQALAHPEWLMSLLEKGWVIEMGQRRKQVVKSSGSSPVDFVPATPHCWLPSFDLNNESIPLKSYVALFSQPGPEVNRALIAAGFDLLDSCNVSELSWAEWGAGYGNLSAAYASRLGNQGWVSEFEPAAATLLELNAQEFFPTLKRQRASASDHDLDSERAGQQAELWLIDPPRSGFESLLKTLQGATHRPRWVLAYHCHHAGLRTDTQALRDAHYVLRAWSSVDAFPATPHHEVISLWEKDL